MSAEVAKCVFSIDAKNAMQQLNLFGSKLDGVGNLAHAAQAALGGLFSGGLIMAARSFVDAASDAQETTQKFGVVFSSVSAQADAAVKKLVSTYNMSTHAARTALSDTGDLLSGFGFTGAAALDLSEKINQLGSDLASFTNYEGGAKGAAEALTKALLGEREQAKMLGIAISEEQVQAQMAADKKAGLTYQSQAHAKAYATYAIAVRQSGNAIGDAERSTESYTYNVKKLQNNLDDLKRTIGAALIGPATAISKALANTVQWFNSLNPAIVKFAAQASVVTGILGSATISIIGLVGCIKSYCAVQTLATVAAADRAAKITAETTATVGLTASTTSNTASLSASTAAKIAQTKATVAHTEALIAESAASKAGIITGTAGTLSGAAGSATAAASTAATAATAASAIPYWAKGVDYSASMPRLRTVAVPPMANGVPPALVTHLANNSKLEATKVAKLAEGSKYRNMGATIAKNSALKSAGVTKITSAASLLSLGAWLPGYKAVFGKIGSLFTKFGVVFGKFAGMLWKPVTMLGAFLGPTKIFGGVIARLVATFAGFAIPFVGWGTAIATGAGLLAAAVKKMPMALEYLIQEIWPKVKSGMFYVVGKVAEFLTPSNIWKLIKNGAKAFGNLLVDGAKAVAETAKRVAGYETETQKTYIGNKIDAALAETKKRAEEAAEAERKLAAQREESIKAMTVQGRDMAKMFSSMFATGTEEKQAERKKGIEEQQKKLDSVFGNKKEQANELLAQKTIRDKEIEAVTSELEKLKAKNTNTKVGDGQLASNAASAEELETKLKTLFAQDDKAKEKLKGLDIDPKAVQSEFEKLLTLKAEDAKETAKENREANETKSNNAFERSMLGATGEAKTEALQKRLAELEAALNNDKTLYSKQEEARSKLKAMATDKDNPENAKLAEAAVNGDKESLEKIGELYGGLFAELGAMITDSAILEKEKAVKEAKEALKESQKEERDISNRTNEDNHSKALNESIKKMEEGEAAWNNAKENAMKMSTSIITSANNQYIKSISNHANNQRNALKDQLKQIDTEMSLETDEGKLSELRSQRVGKEQELSNLERDTNKKLKAANKERQDLEKEKVRANSEFWAASGKMRDDLLLKSAQTSQQKLMVYKKQFNNLLMAYQKAPTNKDKLAPLEKMMELGDVINEELKAEAEKQQARDKNTWAAQIGPSKGVSAGSSEAFQIQNRLYNTHQKTIEKTTKDMLNVNRFIYQELCKVRAAQWNIEVQG